MGAESGKLAITTKQTTRYSQRIVEALAEVNERAYGSNNKVSVSISSPPLLSSCYPTISHMIPISPDISSAMGHFRLISLFEVNTKTCFAVMF